MPVKLLLFKSNPKLSLPSGTALTILLFFRQQVRAPGYLAAQDRIQGICPDSAWNNNRKITACPNPYFAYFWVTHLKAIRYISRVIAILLLAVMAQSIYCSAACAFGGDNCCSSMKEASGYKKSCCSKKSEEKKPTGNCQDEHLAFFKTVGKYHSIQEVAELKVFESIPPIIYPVLNFIPVEINFSFFDNTGFHPPPLNDEVRILLHRFQI